MTPPKLSEVNGWVNNVIHHHSPNERDGMNVPGGVMGVVMHTMEGNLPGTDQEFEDSATQLSAHFGIGQDGTIIQWVSIRGGISWAEMGGNDHWYSIEHADNRNPNNPLTQAQMNSSAQLLELLSRVGNFPLQEANSPGEEGYGVHYMGGAAWGGHSCPDLPPNHVRSRQRPEIIALAKKIRAGSTAPTPPAHPAPLPVLRLGAAGPDVTKLQVRLNVWGAKLTVDGSFGPLTGKAVRAFQASHHLTVDGVVGPKTWAALASNPQPAK